MKKSGLKKLIVVTGVVAIMSGALTACGGSSDGNEKTTAA